VTDFFLHIPKTAGRSITRIIERNYPEDRRVAGQQTGLFFPADRRDGVPLRGGTKTPIDVADLPPHDTILTGHIPFDCIAGARSRFRIFTMLRDPVDRLISEYNHAATAPYHYLHEHVRDDGISFRDYCLSDFVLTADNIQTRFLAGCNGTRDFGEVTRADYEDALRNLLSLDAFGLQERFAESLSLIAWTFGWAPETLSLDRVGHVGRKVRRKDLDPQLVSEIQNRNALDMALHAAAAAEFGGRIDRDRGRIPEGYWAIPDSMPARSSRRPAIGGILRSVRRRLG
jgi:hypothetical protein